MTKISSKSVYPKKNPISDDYFVGTDSENFGKTVNFGFEATAGLINKLNGTPILNYVFNTSPYIDTEVLVEGQFLSLASELNTPELTKLYVNKFNNSGDNLGELYLFLKDNATDFYLKLRNSNNQNNVVYFNIASIESFQDYFILNISVFKENEFFPLLQNLNVYFFDFELKAVSAGSDPLKLDKSTYTGNAQDLDTRIDALENLPTASVITSETGFSLVELNFTINALWEWILNNANYSNPAPVIIPISLCAAGKKRISYIVPNNTNGFSLINGVETTGIPTAPSIPNKGMYVSFFIVTDSLIDTPSEPNVGSIPSLEDVIRTSPFTTLPFTIQEKLSDTSSNSGLYLHSRYLSLWNWLAEVSNYVSIKWDNIGVGTVYQLPNKPNSSTQTFAMLSDIVTDTSKENIANKSQDVETDKLSVTKYPSVKALYDWAVGKFQLTETNFGTFANSLTAKNTLVDADEVVSDDSADGSKAKKTTWLNVWTNYIKVKSDVIYATKALTVRKISTATTLAESDNGTVILLTASCTVTLPNGLSLGWNCSFVTATGATMTYSLGGSIVLINNTATTMAEKLSHTITNTGVSNEYLTVGL